MRDFADFAVLPDDHRQAALAKFEALSPSSAAVSLGGDTHPFRHFLLKNRFERLSYSRVHWLLEKVRDRESRAFPSSIRSRRRLRRWALSSGRLLIYL